MIFCTTNDDYPWMCSDIWNDKCYFIWKIVWKQKKKNIKQTGKHWEGGLETTV